MGVPCPFCHNLPRLSPRSLGLLLRNFEGETRQGSKAQLVESAIHPLPSRPCPSPPFLCRPPASLSPPLSSPPVYYPPSLLCLTPLPLPCSHGGSPHRPRPRRSGRPASPRVLSVLRLVLADEGGDGGGVTGRQPVILDKRRGDRLGGLGLAEAEGKRPAAGVDRRSNLLVFARPDPLLAVGQPAAVRRRRLIDDPQ